MHFEHFVGGSVFEVLPAWLALPHVGWHLVLTLSTLLLWVACQSSPEARRRACGPSGAEARVPLERPARAARRRRRVQVHQCVQLHHPLRSSISVPVRTITRLAVVFLSRVPRCAHGADWQEGVGSHGRACRLFAVPCRVPRGRAAPRRGVWAPGASGLRPPGRSLGGRRAAGRSVGDGTAVRPSHVHVPYDDGTRLQSKS